MPSVDIGYVVSDLIITGFSRGTYKVWVPKKHWRPENYDYSGFGVNLNNLSEGDRQQAVASAKNYYPLFPLSSGGYMPYDTNTGIVSTDEANPEISSDSTLNVSSTGQVTYKKNYYPSGNNAHFNFRQSSSASSLCQTYVFATKAGYTANIRPNAPRGNMAKLSIGTRVLVIDHYIIGMFPENQNDWVNLFAPLNFSD